VLATAFQETGGKMQPIEKNLNYTSATRIRQVWLSRFSMVAAAQPYVRNPQALANKVYGGRMGNTGVNYGWLFPPLQDHSLGRGYRCGPCDSGGRLPQGQGG